jgi:hypothetical protein
MRLRQPRFGLVVASVKGRPSKNGLRWGCNHPRCGVVPWVEPKNPALPKMREWPMFRRPAGKRQHKKPALDGRVPPRISELVMSHVPGSPAQKLVPTAEVDFGHRIAPAPGMARTDDAGVQSPCWEVGFQGDWIRVCRPKAGARACFANKRLRAVRDKRLPKPVYWPVTSMGTEGARGISAQKNRQGACKVRRSGP